MNTNPEPTEEQRRLQAMAIRALRELTSAGLWDCKEALTLTGYNFEEAVALLRVKGLAIVQREKAQ